MTILIAGRSGQVAGALLARAPAGRDCVALGRPELDISREETVRQAFDTHKPSLVINSAAYTAVDQAETDSEAAFAINRDGPEILAHACKRAGIPLIHFSTDCVFDGRKEIPYTEEDPANPLSLYGRSKLAGEDAVRAVLEDHLILRVSWVFSRFGRGNFVKTMLRLAKDRDEVTVVCDQVGYPTSAVDLADAVFEMVAQIEAGRATFGTFHLASQSKMSRAEQAEAIFEASRALGGPHARVKPVMTADYPTPASRPLNSRLDCARLKSVYGLELPGWRETLPACVKELLEAGVET